MAVLRVENKRMPPEDAKCKNARLLIDVGTDIDTQVAAPRELMEMFDQTERAITILQDIRDKATDVMAKRFGFLFRCDDCNEVYSELDAMWQGQWHGSETAELICRACYKTHHNNATYHSRDASTYFFLRRDGAVQPCMRIEVSRATSNVELYAAIESTMHIRVYYLLHRMTRIPRDSQRLESICDTGYLGVLSIVERK